MGLRVTKCPLRLFLTVSLQLSVVEDEVVALVKKLSTSTVCDLGQHYPISQPHIKCTAMKCTQKKVCDVGRSHCLPPSSSLLIITHYLILTGRRKTIDAY